MMSATVIEAGNGMPDIGDYVRDYDGQVYRVVELGRYHTGKRCGDPMWAAARVERADLERHIGGDRAGLPLPHH